MSKKVKKDYYFYSIYSDILYICIRIVYQLALATN